MSFSEAVEINPRVKLKRGNSYPFVSMKDLDPNIRYAYASELREFKGSGSKFELGDTLMARITPCLENGKISRYRSYNEGLSAQGSTEFIVIRGRHGFTTNDYVYYLTRWNEVRNYAIDQMTGTSGRQRVPTNSLDHLIILIPPINEQQEIARVLGALDDKIELNRRMNETLEEMALALFKSWFVDFDPVRAKMDGRWQSGQSLPSLPAELYDHFPDRLVPSELGEIPEGWHCGPLRSIIHTLTEKENPLKSPNNIFNHFSIPAYDKGLLPNYELGCSIKSQKIKVQPQVVLISKLNPEIERVWLVDISPEEQAICSTEFLVAKAISPFRRSYIYCLARSFPFRTSLESLVTGTSKSHQRAPISAVLASEILVPPAQLVTTFDELVACWLDNCLSNLRESTSLIALRDLLLPKLLTGEIRVGDLSTLP